MTHALRHEIKQTKPFGSPELEAFLAILVTSNRVLEPWERYLRANATLTPNQYNVLRILRGAGAEGIKTKAIGERMISRQPDVTRLVDRLVQRGYAIRTPSAEDHRVVHVRISVRGLEELEKLDPMVAEMPVKLLGHMGEPALRDLTELLGRVVKDLGTFP